MKTVKFVPSVAKGEEKTFEGFIELKPLGFDERFEMLDVLGIDLDDEGKIELPQDKKAQIRMMRKMVDFAKKQYLTVSLKKLSTGEEYTSFDDLSIDQDCNGILIEVATQVMNGFKLGNG